MRKRKGKRLIGKWRLAIGAVLTLWGLGNLFFNKEWTDVRAFCHLHEDPYSLRSLFTRKANVESDDTGVLVLSSQQLNDFFATLSVRVLPEGGLPPLPEPPAIVEVPIIDPGNPVEPGYEPWPVPIIGVEKTDGGYRALIASRGPRPKKCDADMIIRSSTNRLDRCDYRVLAVREKCVWLLAIGHGTTPREALSSFDDVAWPPIVRIYRDHGVRQVARKNNDAVILANGRRVRRGESYYAAREGGGRYMVRSLWDNGVCFDIFANGGDRPSGRIVCMLLVKGR